MSERRKGVKNVGKKNYGVFLILGGIILYVICKPVFGGCSVEHPDK